MKYIDAEKLKAEIERLEVLYDEALKNPSFPNDEAYLIAKGKHRQREDILRLIDSLQQEQPGVCEPEYGPYARQYPKSKVSQEQPEVDNQ